MLYPISVKIYAHSSYDEYRQAQIEKNRRKLERVFTTEQEVDAIASRVPRPIELGICHGVRNGWEVQAFRTALGTNAIIGTDISPTAGRVDGCIVWDFHEVDPAWVGRTDFIYSNALDHSYDPELCLGSWLSCLSERGVCVINWHKTRLSRVDRADCFRATVPEVAAMIGARGRLIETVRLRGRTLFFATRADAPIH